MIILARILLPGLGSDDLATPEGRQVILVALGLIVASIGLWVLLHFFDRYRRGLDRERIEGDLARYGWTLTDLRPTWRLLNLYDRRSLRRYRATYLVSGHPVTAECDTSLFAGVQWLNGPPPGTTWMKTQ